MSRKQRLNFERYGQAGATMPTRTLTRPTLPAGQRGPTKKADCVYQCCKTTGIILPIKGKHIPARCTMQSSTQKIEQTREQNDRVISGNWQALMHVSSRTEREQGSRHICALAPLSIQSKTFFYREQKEKAAMRVREFLKLPIKSFLMAFATLK